MANKDKVVMQYVGKLDVNDITTKLKQIQDSVKSKGLDILGIDKSMESLEQLEKEIQKTISKGFQTPADVKNIDRMVASYLKNAEKINEAFQKVSANNLTKQINEAKEAVEQVRKSQESSIKSAKEVLNTQALGVKNGKKYAAQLIEQVKNGESLENAQKSITTQLQAQVKAQKEQVALSEKNVQSAKTKVEDLTAKEQSSTVSKGVFRYRQNFTKNGQAINDQDYDIIKGVLSKTTRDGASKGTDSAIVYENFLKQLKNRGIEYTKSNTISGSKQGQQNIDRQIEYYKNLQTQIKAAQQELKDYEKTYKESQKNLAAAQDEETQVTGLITDKNAVKYLNEITRSIQDLTEKLGLLKQAEEQQNENTPDYEDVSHKIDEADRSAGAYVDTNAELAQKANDIGTNFDNAISTLKTYISLGAGIRQISEIFKDTYNNVKDLDKAFSEIAMVTDYSVEDMWKSYSQYATMANQLGQETQNVVKASGLFYQQGLDTNEALSLTSDTMKLATLSGLDYEEATSSMTAALRGFHMEMNQGSHITDVYSELAAKAAADVEGISNAMNKTASIANSAGMSFENTAAFLTQMIETTQESPENLGTALKTIIARFTELKENIAGTAESEFDDLNYNKVDEALKSVGISLKDTTGQFRNLDEVFLELSKKWNTLDRNTQRYIATTAAGSRQQSRFIAMMENYDRTLELINAAQNSAGKANEQYSKYADTIENKVIQLQNSWEQLKISILGDDLFKDLVTKAKQALDALSSLQKRIGTGGLIGVIALLGKALKTVLTTNLNSLKKGLQELENRKNKINIDKSQVENATKDVTTLDNKLQEMSKGEHIVRITTVESTISEEEYEQSQWKNLQNPDENIDFGNIPTGWGSPEAPKPETPKSQRPINDASQVPGEVTPEQKKQSAHNGEVMGQIVSQAFIGTMTGMLTSDGGIENVILSTVTAVIPQVTSLVGTFFKWVTGSIAGTAAAAEAATAAVTMGISAAIAVFGALLVNAYKDWEKFQEDNSVEIQTENAQKELEELQAKLTETKDKIDELNSSKEELSDAITDYNTLSNKVIRTDDEEERLSDAYTTLTETYPEILNYYDDETQKLSINTEAYQNKTKAIQEQLDAQKKLLQQQELLTFNQTVKADKLQAAKDYQDKTGIKINASTLTQDINWKYNEDVASSAFKSDTSGNYYDQLEVDRVQSRHDAISNILGLGDYAWANGEQRDQIDQVMDYVWGDLQSLDTSKIEAEQLDAIYQLKADTEELINSTSNYFTDALATAKNQVEAEDSNLSESEKAIKATEKAIALNKVAQTSTLQDAMDKIEDYNADAFSDLKESFEKDTSVTFNDETSKKLDSIATDFQDAANDITDGWNTKDNYSTLGDKTKSLLKEYMGIENAQDYNTWTDNGAKTDADAMHDLMEAYFNKLVEEAESYKDFSLSDDAKAAAKKLFSPEDLTEEQYNAQLESLKQELAKNLSEEEQEQILSTLAPEWEQHVKNLALQTRLLGKNTEMGAENADKLAAALSQVEEAGVDAAEAYLSSMSSYLKDQGIKDEDIATYLQIDWTQVQDPSQLESFKKSTIEQFQELGYEIDSEMFDAVAKIAKSFGYLHTIVSNPAELTAYEKTLSDIRETAYGSKDTFISAINEQAENGIITLSTYLSLQEKISELGGKITDFTTINKEGSISLNTGALSAFYIEKISSAQKLKAQRDAITQELSSTVSTSEREALQKTLDQLNEDLPQAQALQDAYIKDYKNSLEQACKEAKEKVKDLKETVQKAQNDVLEKQKALNEAINGTANWINSADDLYNYTTNLERLTKAADDAKSSLEDLQGEDPQQYMSTYLDNVKREQATSQAEIQTYERTIENGQKVLNQNLISAIKQINKETGENMSTDLSGLYTKVGDRYNIDYNKINSYNLNDSIKTMIVDEIKSWNEDLDAIDDLQKKKLDRQKEFKELYKNSLQGMVDLQEKMKDTLKEKYDQEISDLENKYQAMEKADNDYVDELEKAIEKQRKLRDQEKSWNELADKERKLSLMQRDTSGGNLADTRSLQKEVQDDRQDLLDNAVDNIVDSLKEMYELQQESREAEIEYRKTLIDEGVLMQEVTAALSNINSAQDLVDWFYQNTADLSTMSAEQIQLEEDSWRELYDSKMSWLVTSQTDFNSSLKVTQDDINNTISSTTETLTSSAQTTLDQVQSEVTENIQTAKDNLTEALDSLKEAQNNLTEAIKASDAASKALKDTTEELDKALQKIYKDALGKDAVNGTDTHTTANEEQRKAIIAAAREWDKDDKAGFLKKYGSYSDAEQIFDNYGGITGTLSGKIKVGKWEVKQNKQSKNNSGLHVWTDVIQKEQDKKILNNYSKKYFDTTGTNSSYQSRVYDSINSDTDKEKLKEALKRQGWDVTDASKDDTRKLVATKKFAQGGMVDFTGPAWVDGTKSRPEAFLNADDTKRIGEAAKLLSDLPLLDNPRTQTNEISNTNVGDTTFEIHINVENISSDYDVDQAVERVKQDIADAAQYAGSNVILKKK